MTDPRALTEIRTFRWNDGRQTDGYQAVEISRALVRWFRWSHVHGQGRIDEGEQTLRSLLEEGPARPAPRSVLDELSRIARRYAESE